MTRAAEEKPAFILHTGDLTRHGTPEEYTAHHMVLVKEIAPVPLIAAPGNHDDGPNKDFAPFKAVYGDLRFSFEYGDCRFVGVNDCAGSGISQADLEYLKQELGKPGAKHKFVIVHKPPDYLQEYVKCEDGRGFRKNAGPFRELLKAQGVEQAFMGHVHGYASQAIDGVRYTITGGGGAPLTKVLPAEGRVNNFVLVHVSPAGVKLEVLRLMGEQWERSDIP
jgi:3',5'-cyclic AMP phosphodiesterase CpdA